MGWKSPSGSRGTATGGARGKYPKTESGAPQKSEQFLLIFNVLSCFSTLTRDIDIASLSVCLSVRLSVSLTVRDVPV